MHRLISFLSFFCLIFIIWRVTACVERHKTARAYYLAAIHVMESSLTRKREEWVKSSNWEARGRETLLASIQSLPYHRTESLGSSHSQCEACSGKHRATHKITFFGVDYIPDQLQHPFDLEKLIPGGFSSAFELNHCIILLSHILICCMLMNSP